MLDDPTSTPAIVPSPDPMFSGKGLRPFLETPNTDRRHEEVRGSVERHQKLEHAMLLEEAKMGITLDQGLRELLIAIIIQQPDGSEVYLPGLLEKYSEALKKSKDESEVAVMALRERSGADMTGIIKSLTEMKKILENEGKSGVDTAASVAAIQAVLDKELGLRALRTGTIDIAFIGSSVLKQGNMTRLDLRTAILATDLPAEFKKYINDAVPDDDAEEAKLLDQDFIKLYLEGCVAIVTKEFEGIKTAAVDLRTEIKKRLTEEDVKQRNLIADIADERRLFNSKLGGTDAEIVLGFAKVDKNKYDLKLLEKQMHALGWNEVDPDSTATSADKIEEANREYRIQGIQTVLETSDITLDITDTKKLEDLKKFIAEKTQSNPPGVSLSKMSERVEIFSILQSFAYKVIEENTSKGVVNIDEVISAIQIKTESTSSSLNIDTLQKAAGINDRNEIDERQKIKLASEIAKILDKEALTLDEVKKVTEINKSTIPFSETVKNYARDGGVVSGVAIDTWWEWIKSLPNNVINTTIDKELNASLVAENDLARLDAALDTIIPDGSSLFEGKGILVDLENAYDREQKKVENITTALAAASLSAGPATNLEQRLARSKDLIEVGQKVWKELNEQSCFVKIDDPILRQRAFFIAMHYGMKEANAYMWSPNTYFSSRNPEAEDVIDQAEVNYIRGREGKGDLLAPLELYGLSMDPRASVIMASTLTRPNCIPLSIDCPPRIALERILRGDPDRVKNLIDAYINRTDIGDPTDPKRVTFEEALKMVNGIKQHLNAQDHDAQKGIESTKDKRFDPLNAINSSFEVIKGMMFGDTFAEKALGWALVGGTVYGIIKAWPKHWKLIMTGPMLLAANIALKRATGKSIADYFNLHFMSEEDRNTSHEQLVRRTRFVEGYEDVESPAGREAMRAITDATPPIPVEKLLLFRKKMKGAGPDNFAEAAKHTGIKTSKILKEMGVMEKNGSARDENKNKAYELALKAFDAICIDVARARNIGGISPEQQADAGADYIRRLYTIMEPDCCTPCVGMEEPRIVGICGLPPCKKYTAREIMTIERPPDWMYPPMQTWTEYVGANTGVAFGAVGSGVKGVATFVEGQVAQAEESVPVYWDWATENIMESYDSFERWRRVSYEKSGAEFTEDPKATWQFLSKTVKATGLAIKVHGPEKIEWVYDKGVTGVALTRDGALSVYRGLKKMHVTGPFLVGLEDRIAKELAPVAELELADLTDVPTFKKSIIDLFANKILVTNDMQNFLDKIMGAALLNIEAETNLRSRAVKMELLKRSLYSYLMASRMQAIAANPLSPSIQTPLHIDFSTISIDSATYKLTGVNPAMQEYYNHIFSHYTSKKAGILLGQDQALGITLDLAAMQEGPLGTGASVLNWVGDSILWDTAGDYLKGSLAVYLDPIIKEAENSLTPAEAELFRPYVETLLMNVIVEMTLSDEDPNVAPLHLTVKRAKEYLTELQTNRGGAPTKVVDEGFLNIGPALKLYEMVQEPSDAVENLRRDPIAGQYFGGGLGLLLPPSSASPASSPSPTPLPTGPTAPTSSPAPLPTGPTTPAPTADIDPILRVPGNLTPENQDKLLHALPSSGSKEDDIRGKFDSLIKNKLKTTPDPSPAGRAELLNAYIGASDGFGWGFGTYKSQAENLFLERFNRVADLESVANEFSIATDSTAKTRLLQLAKRSLGARLSEIFVDAIASKPDATSQAKQCLTAAQKLDALAKDKASMLMEYIFCKGDYTNPVRTFAQYQAFAPKIDYVGAQFRFSKGLKLTESTIERNFDALK